MLTHLAFQVITSIVWTLYKLTHCRQPEANIRLLAGASEGDLATLCKQCLQIAESYTRNYIWQKDGFKLRQAPLHLQPWLKAAEPSSSQERCLWGETSFGDNIEDEWLIAWILLQMTRQNDKISARVWDTDGEFLLIEAAYALPP